jgi:hypothetical protein
LFERWPENRRRFQGVFDVLLEFLLLKGLLKGVTPDDYPVLIQRGATIFRCFVY